MSGSRGRGERANTGCTMLGKEGEAPGPPRPSLSRGRGHCPTGKMLLCWIFPLIPSSALRVDLKYLNNLSVWNLYLCGNNISQHLLKQKLSSSEHFRLVSLLFSSLPYLRRHPWSSCLSVWSVKIPSPFLIDVEIETGFTVPSPAALTELMFAMVYFCIQRANIDL